MVTSYTIKITIHVYLSDLKTEPYKIGSAL